MTYESARPLRIERDPDRERANANEEVVTAVGVQMPSGSVIIEWRREAFAPEERSEKPVVSHYRNINDAEEATAGNVVFDDYHAQIEENHE